MPQWLAQRRGERVFIVTERSHSGGAIGHVRATGGEAHEVTSEWEQNKFVLIEATVGNGAPAQRRATR
jgi:hypothetical protein